MDSLRFNVVLTGGISDGHSKEAVASDLAQLIKREQSFTHRLLDGRAVTIRGGVDQATAQRYADSLQRIGVEVRIEPETLEIDDVFAGIAEPSAAPTQSPVAPLAALGLAVNVSATAPAEALDFPTCDLEPAFVGGGFFEDWTFQGKDGSLPPAWTADGLDYMVSETYVFFVARSSRSSALGTVGKAGLAAALVAGTLAAIALPVAAMAAGAATYVVADAGARRKKHPGYGVRNQFRPEALVQSFAAGDVFWAARDECEFRGWRTGSFMGYTHHVAIAGTFHHMSGLLQLAGVASMVYGAEQVKDIAKATGWNAAAEYKYKSPADGWRDWPGFLPPIKK